MIVILSAVGNGYKVGEMKVLREIATFQRCYVKKFV
jgi:hypothetical protein